MEQRYISIWFRHLNTDWFSLRQTNLKTLPFVLKTPSHGRMVITSVNYTAEKSGITTGMVLADARALLPELQVMDDNPDLPVKLLTRLAEWCIRFTPIAGIDPPDGILLDASGCAHLWGGEELYLREIIRKLNARGYDIRAAMADTPGVAWAVARYGQSSHVVARGNGLEALFPLPPQALRLEPESVERLHKLGLHQICKFIKMPRSSLRRRFGSQILKQIDLALGQEIEIIKPVIPVEPFQERLPCLDPVATAPGIEMALQQLLNKLCHRLLQEQKGLRKTIFKCYRVDGKLVQVDIGTNRPTHHVSHLLKLFETKLPLIEPGLGIDLFILEATVIEEHLSRQEKMWEDSSGLEDSRLAEFLDRVGGKVGVNAIHRYLPDEHFWPERSLKISSSLLEEPLAVWSNDKLRPLQLLRTPERIEVTAPIPDYPPMLFRYKGAVHKIIKSDGPERIEQEWWIQQGKHRDYYRVEDEDGRRYWIFRLGHYHEESYQWFLHGQFA
jgi:protein ImuB